MAAAGRIRIHAFTPDVTGAMRSRAAGAQPVRPMGTLKNARDPRQPVKVRVTQDDGDGRGRRITEFAAQRADVRTLIGFLIAGYRAIGLQVLLSGNEGRALREAGPGL